MTSYLAKYSKHLSGKVPRPVEHVRYISYNGITVSKIFAQEQISHAKMR